MSYIELIIGPMFSGKTSRLIEVYKQCKYCNIGVTAINHRADTRYGVNVIGTHDGAHIPCIMTDRLSNLLKSDDEVENGQTDGTDATKALRYAIDVFVSEVILINEAQFFPDLVDFVTSPRLQNKKVYIGGLDGDYLRQPIGHILELIPLCDKVTKLTSLCSQCKDGTPAIFTRRVTQETEQVVIGTDQYQPLCRACYQKE